MRYALVLSLFLMIGIVGFGAGAQGTEMGELATFSDQYDSSEYTGFWSELIGIIIIRPIYYSVEHVFTHAYELGQSNQWAPGGLMIKAAPLAMFVGLALHLRTMLRRIGYDPLDAVDGVL
jgi:hypothetical protein